MVGMLTYLEQVQALVRDSIVVDVHFSSEEGFDGDEHDNDEHDDEDNHHYSTYL